MSGNDKPGHRDADTNKSCLGVCIMLDLKMTKDSRKFIEEHCPELFEEKDLRSFLIEFDDFIIMYGMDSNDDMTPLGNQAQRIYEEIYMLNE